MCLTLIYASELDYEQSLLFGEVRRAIQKKSVKKRYVSYINPLHPNISMHIIHTVLYAFLKVLTRRIC